MSVLLLFTSELLALDVNLELGYAGRYSDNVRLTGGEEKSDLRNALTSDLTAEHDRDDVRLTAGYHLEKQSYQNDTFEDEETVAGNARMDWLITPRGWLLSLIHDKRDVLIDAQLDDLPENRDSRSVYGVSTTYQIIAAPEDQLAISGALGKQTFQDRDSSDYKIGSVKLSWRHVFSEYRDTMISLRNDELEFDVQNGTDSRIRSASITHNERIRNAQISLTGGRDELRRDNGNNDKSDQYGFSLTYSLNSQMDIQLSTERMLLDSAAQRLSSASMELDGAFDTVYQEQVGSDAVVRRRSNLFINRRTSAYDFNIIVYKHEEDYQFLLQDLVRKGARVSYSHHLSGIAIVGVEVGYNKQQFLDTIPVIEHETPHIMLRNIWHYSNDLDVTASLRYSNRHSNDNVIEYDETSAMLTISYRVL